MLVSKFSKFKSQSPVTNPLGHKAERVLGQLTQLTLIVPGKRA